MPADALCLFLSLERLSCLPYYGPLWFEPYMEVTYFRLTRVALRSRIPMGGLNPGGTSTSGALASFSVHCCCFLYFIGTVLIVWLVFSNPEALA
jgi:hypothetical protein